MMFYLIWSNEHRAWWRGNERGYTGYIEEAGRYTYGEAYTIVRKATLNGELTKERTDPATGETYMWASEAMIQAPEVGMCKTTGGTGPRTTPGQ